MAQLPNAEIVIIGGGAVGCGVAYALAKTGRTDVLLLERAEDLGRATTAQGAGLCGQPRDSVDRVRLAMHSVATFRELQRDAEVKPDWHEVGSLRIALTEKRATEFRNFKQASDAAGLETALIDRVEAKRLWSLMDFTKATAILWCPSDGYMTPGCVVKAYAHQCRKLGVRFATSNLVEGITVKNGRAAGVRTNQGSVECRASLWDLLWCIAPPSASAKSWMECSSTYEYEQALAFSRPLPPHPGPLSPGEGESKADFGEDGSRRSHTRLTGKSERSKAAPPPSGRG